MRYLLGGISKKHLPKLINNLTCRFCPSASFKFFSKSEIMSKSTLSEQLNCSVRDSLSSSWICLSDFSWCIFPSERKLQDYNNIKRINRFSFTIPIPTSHYWNNGFEKASEKECDYHLIFNQYLEILEISLQHLIDLIKLYNCHYEYLFYD